MSGLLNIEAIIDLSIGWQLQLYHRSIFGRHKNWTSGETKTLHKWSWISCIATIFILLAFDWPYRGNDKNPDGWHPAIEYKNLKCSQMKAEIHLRTFYFRKRKGWEYICSRYRYHVLNLKEFLRLSEVFVITFNC